MSLETESDSISKMVEVIHVGEGGDIVTYITILLTDDEDKHNFRKHDICLYGKDLNITIKKHFVPDLDFTEISETTDTIGYGYIIYDGTLEYNKDIIESIKTNIKNRILFS